MISISRVQTQHRKAVGRHPDQLPALSANEKYIRLTKLFYVKCTLQPGNNKRPSFSFTKVLKHMEHVHEKHARLEKSYNENVLVKLHSAVVQGLHNLQHSNNKNQIIEILIKTLNSKAKQNREVKPTKNAKRIFSLKLRQRNISIPGNHCDYSMKTQLQVEKLIDNV